MKPISVIIPVWNALDFSKKCISLLLKAKSSIDEVIVIDNGSTDNTRDYLALTEKENPGWFLTHHFKENRGFVEAVNFGISMKKPQNDIILMNNDVEIHDPKLFKILQDKAYSLEKCAALSPKQVRENGDFLCGPCFTLPISLRGHSYGNEQDVNQFNKDLECEQVMFACCYIRNDALEEIGILDENIFSYAEDSDWCLRAREKGWKIWYTGENKVIHHSNTSCKVNKVEQSIMHENSLVHFRKKWTKKLDDRYVMDLTVQGATGAPTGYSHMTEQIMRNLEEGPDRIKVHYGFAYGIVDHELVRNLNYFVYIDELRKRQGFIGGVHLIIGQGDIMYKNSGDYRIGYTMMDCDAYPTEWIRQINMLDEVFVPTEHGKEVMVSSGIKPKITVIPLGIDQNYYHKDVKPLDDIMYTKFRREVNFCSVFEWGERKMPEILIDAWYKAFGDNPDIALFIKFTAAEPDKVRNSIIGSLGNRRSKAKIVPVTNPPFRGYVLPHYMHPSFFKSHDAFVLTSAAEGWGLPAHEAMACGVPVGVTGKFGFFPEHQDLKGQTLFDWAWEDITGPEMVRCPYYWGARWAKPKVDDVVDKLRYMYDNLSTLKEQALVSSERICQEFTWANTARMIKDRIIPENKKLIDKRK